MIYSNSRIQKTISLILLIFCAGTSALYAQRKNNFYDNKLVEYRYTTHLDSVLYYFKKALPTVLQEKDSVTVFYLYKHLGDAYEHHNQIDSTLKMYDICERYIPAGNYKLKSFLLNDRAYTYTLLFDYDKAADLTLQALEFAKKSGDKREIASVSISVAEGFSGMNLNKQAEQYYRQSISIAIDSKDTGMLSHSYRYYAVHLLKNKQWQQAFVNLNKAKNISIYLNDSISMAFAWHYLADYYWNVKQTDSSFYYAKKAEGVWERRAEYIDLSDACIQIGKFYLQLGNYKDAGLYLRKAEKHMNDSPYTNEDLYSALAELYNKTGNDKLAFDYLVKAKQKAGEIKEKESKAKVMSLRLKFEADQKEIEIKKERERRALADLNLKKKTNQRNIVFIVLACVMLVLGIIVFAYVKIRNKNKLLSQSNADLESLAKQKQILLKEVHHRVKNNLTTLKSLFYLQAKSSDKEEVKLALEECQQRIQSMALIHQSLYEENENERIEFLHFLKQLFNELELSAKPVNKEIEIEYKGLNVELDMSTALFLGLILNELATNSYKYAFKEMQEGKIGVELQRNNSQLIIIYYDAGVGIPLGYEQQKGGFGFKLMRILTEQINAVITYQKLPNKSEFKIEVPLEQ